MTAADVHNQLLEIRRIEHTIARLRIQRDELQTCLLPQGIRYDKDTVQTAPGNPMADIAGRVVDMDMEIRALSVDKSKLIVRFSKLFAELDNDDEKTVLNAYYIGRMSGYKIATDVIAYSPQRIYQLRWSGLTHLAEKSRHILHEACDIV